MREIKFRAWNKYKKVMVYKDEDNSSNYLDGICMSDVDFINSSLMENDTYDWMQFTGLHDKNGKEIYEGDIVRKDGWIYEIRWSKYGAGFDLATKNDSWPKQEDGYAYHSGLYDTEIIEVIGNIYENPELIKDEEVE